MKESLHQAEQGSSIMTGIYFFMLPMTVFIVLFTVCVFYVYSPKLNYVMNMEIFVSILFISIYFPIFSACICVVVLHIDKKLEAKRPP